MIEVPCVCGKTYQVPDGSAGRKLQCRRCGAIQRIPRTARALAESDPLIVSFQMPGASEDGQGGM